MEVRDFLKKLLGVEQEPDYDKWQQVVVLKPADVTIRRNRDARQSELLEQAKVLMKKLEVAKAQLEVESAEWWEYVHKTYALPRDRVYHLTDDDRLLMAPKECKRKGCNNCGGDHD